MPGPHPARIWLANWQRRELAQLARAAKSPQALVERARIVLLAHQDRGFKHLRVRRRGDLLTIESGFRQ